jgi:hypothetical protein
MIPNSHVSVLHFSVFAFEWFCPKSFCPFKKLAALVKMPALAPLAEAYRFHNVANGA